MKEYWKEALVTITIGIVLGAVQLWQKIEPTVLTSAKPIGETTGELMMWQGIVNSNTASDFEGYLNRYPNGQFVDIAKNRLQQFSLRPVPIPILKSQQKAIAETQYNFKDWKSLLNKYHGKVAIPATNGFIIKSAPSLRASTVKIKNEYAVLEMVGHVDADGQRFYITAWSWNQYNKGKNPTWILLK